MPTSSDRTEQLRKRRAELKDQIAHVADLRPGSLVERYRRCGKPNCHCAARGAVAHGPSYSLTHEVHGKTVTKVIPPDAIEQTRRQIAEYQRFRSLAKQLVDTSAQLCDAQLEAPEAAAQEAAQKGGSKRPSRPKSSPRSKRS